MFPSRRFFFLFCFRSLTNRPRLRAANFPLRPSQKGSPEESSFSNSFGVLRRVTGYWPGYLSIIKTIHTYRLSRAGSIVFSALSINVLIDFGPSPRLENATFLPHDLPVLSLSLSNSRSLRAILELILHNRHSVGDEVRERENFARKKDITRSLLPSCRNGTILAIMDSIKS